MECTVSALLVRDGAMLLVEEQGPEDQSPIWMLPGGRVEHGESPEEALCRDVAEDLAGAEPAGARYRYTVTGRHGSVERSVVEVRPARD